MRVAQTSHRARLAQKAIRNIAIAGEFSFDNFNGDRTLESQMCRSIHCAHAACSDLTLDAEPAGDKLRDIHSGPSFGIKADR